MRKYIHTSVISGEISATPSKSYTIRALAGALLSEGYTVITNPAICDDTNAALCILADLGAAYEHSNDSILVKGGSNAGKKILDCGESALCVRLFSAIVPLLNNDMTIMGHGTLQLRNFSELEQSLNSAGLKCESMGGYLPLNIRGNYTKDKFSIDCSISSQFLSGLLFALPTLNFDTSIHVVNLNSKPYIDLTMKILNQFGINIQHKDLKEFKISGNQKYQSTKLVVEGDWSNAAFLLVAGAIAGSVKVSGLSINSYQGDKKILEILDKAGALISIDNDFIKITKNKLKAFEYDASDTPDLFPPLVSLAVNCEGISKIIGTERLVNKESNRMNALLSEFTKLGINITNLDNTLYIEGGDIHGCEVESNNDHRIAMAFAVAGLNSDVPVIIDNTECVTKSYPEFFNDLKKIGGNIHE